MYVQKIADPHTKVAASSTNKLAPQRLVFAARHLAAVRSSRRTCSNGVSAIKQRSGYWGGNVGDGMANDPGDVTLVHPRNRLKFGIEGTLCRRAQKPTRATKPIGSPARRIEIGCLASPGSRT
jgi:hypothetical protein